MITTRLRLGVFMKQQLPWFERSRVVEQEKKKKSFQSFSSVFLAHLASRGYALIVESELAMPDLLAHPRCWPSQRSARWAATTLVGLCCTFVARVGRAESELPPEVGYNYGEIENPRSMALGGADRATSYSLGGLFSNPANMARSAVYHLGGNSEIWPEANRVSFGGAAVDSISNSKGVAGGVGYTWNQQDKETLGRQYNDLRFALAFPLQNKFFLGLGGRYLWLSQNGDGPFGKSLASDGLAGERIVDGFSFDAGLTVKPTDDLYIAVVGNNLTDPGHGFQPTSTGGGVGYATTQFGIEGDVVFDFTTWDKTTARAMGGAELLLEESVPIRIGYRYDGGAESHAISFGIGYVEKSFAAEAALRRVVSGDTATAVVLGLTLHLEASGLTPSPANAF